MGNRAWPMLTVLLALALLLVAARPSSPAAFALSGEGGLIVRVVVEFEDGSTQVLVPGPVVPPPPDATATARLTPPAPLTNTPRPEATPTREVTVIPTAPTSEPPDAGLCMAGVVASTLNVRAEPMISGAKVGQLSQSTRVTVTSLHVVHAEGATNREEWARIPTGWIALWYAGAELARLDDSAPCWELLKTYAEGALPTTAWGAWAGPGYLYSELTQFGETLKTAGIKPAVTLYGDYAQAAALQAAGWVVIVRPWIGGQDCPSFTLPAEVSARAWVEIAFQMTAGLAYDWLVLCNEPVFPSATYGAAWIRAAIDGATELGITHLVPVVWPPGHPEISDVAQLAGAYNRAGLCWGMNLYPTVLGAALGDRGGIQEWTVWRWRLYRHVLPSNVGLCVTEFARSDGTEPPNFEDIGRFVVASDNAYLWATAWYLAKPGGLGHWDQANLRGKLPELAAALH